MKGYRTYILAGLIALATAARYLGWIDESMYQLIAGICGAGAAATIRAGSKADADKSCDCVKSTAGLPTLPLDDYCKGDK